MKKILLLTVVFSVLVAQAQKPKHTTLYYYKKLKSAEGDLLNGKKEGVWTYWSPQGEISKKIGYHEGIYNGIYQIYDTLAAYNAQQVMADQNKYAQSLHLQQNNTQEKDPVIEGTYQNGLQTGLWKRPGHEENFANGELHGEVKQYYMGSLRIIMTYSHNVLHGPYKKYRSNGTLEQQGQYENGIKTGEWVLYDHNLKEVTHYKQDKMDGPVSLYNQQDSLVGSGFYVAGKKNGKFFRSNAQEHYREEMEYVNDKEEGWHKQYRNGRLKSAYLMKNGRENGPYFKYADTTLTEKGFYKNGKLDSSRMTYSLKHHLRCESVYKNGTPLKEDCFDDNQQKVSSTVYTNGVNEKKEITWKQGKKTREVDYSKAYIITRVYNAKGKLESCDTVYRNEPEAVAIENTDMIAVPPPPPPTPELTADHVYQVTETAPMFPPANGNLMDYFDREMVYPEEAKKNNLQGKVYVQCTIMRDGSVRDVKVLKGVSPELDQEAVRLVQKMKGWVPGKMKDQAVNAKQNLIVNFKLH